MAGLLGGVIILDFDLLGCAISTIDSALYLDNLILNFVLLVLVFLPLIPLFLEEDLLTRLSLVFIVCFPIVHF